jgi:hypothetical protein
MSEEVELTEDEIDAQIAARQAGKKKRGRPKNENYLSWDEAREFMRSELIPSRGKFFEWWERNKPKAIPRFPYRVYQEEWTSWNDFLGTNNKFNEKIGTKWRPFLEATVWSLRQGLKSQTEWMEFCKLEGKLPADIPARPDLVYNEWRSWSHWLGNKPVEALQAKQEIAQKVQVYYIIRDQGSPQNVLTFGIEPAGPTALKQRWEEERFDVVRLFWYDPEKSTIIRQIVEALSSAYQGYERQRIVPNVWEIVYHLEMHLDRVR